MTSFIGEYNLKVDDKGRLLFPANLKRQVKTVASGNFVIKEDIFEKCLVLYTMEEWERQNTILRKRLNPFDAKHNMFLRGFAKGAAEVTLDGSGRLLIPRRLIEFAKISKQVVVAGQNAKIEIWAKESYDKLFAEGLIFAELASEVIGGNLNIE